MTLTGLLVIAVVAIANGAQVAQHELSVVVDGSKTPDRIPDDLAYRHFILAIAEHQNPTQSELTRREMRLAPIDLSKNDHDVCISALTGLRERLDAIEAARAAAFANNTTTRDSALTSLKAQEDAAIAGVRLALRGMSSDGQSRLDGYIKTHVKRCIRILR